MSSWPKQWRRRAFLGGAGAFLTLPFLPSLRGARAAGARPPRRFVAWMLPNGVPMGRGVNLWRPTGTSTAVTLSPSLAPLGELAKDVLFVSGLTNLVTYEPGAHASGAGSFLTCTRIAQTADPARLRNGVSLDQLLAQRTKPDTRFDSLALDLAPGRGVGDCDFGLSCLYMFNISWKGGGTPAPKLVSPRAVFDRLFGGLDPAATVAERARQAVYRKSVLDYTREDAQTLMPRLGRSDRAKLDQYLTAVREIEQRLPVADAAKVCRAPSEPRDGLALAERGPLMVDLQLLALECDLTRFLTFKLGAGFNSDDRDFGFLGLRETHHSYSHHGNDMARLDMCLRVVKWEIELFARLLRGMKNTVEVDGSSLLDSAAVYLSSEVSDPDAHSLENFTALLAGRCQGAFAPGRHLDVRKAPVGNLFLAVLRAFGIQDPTFGETGKQPLEGLGA